MRQTLLFVLLLCAAANAQGGAGAEPAEATPEPAAAGSAEPSSEASAAAKPSSEASAPAPALAGGITEQPDAEASLSDLKLPAGPRLFVLDPHLVGIAAPVKKTVSAAIAQAAQGQGLAVLTRDDARDLIAQSTDLAMLGADADGASLAELAKLVGAPHLLTITVSAVDGDTVLHMRLIDAKKAAVVARREVRASAFSGGLVDAVKAATGLVLAPIFAHLSGQVTVRVSEEGANVALDDELIGVSPMKAFAVPGGTHLVVVSKEGFIQETRTVQIEKGTAITLELTLRPSVEFATNYKKRNSLYRTLAWASTGVAAPALVVTAGATAFFLRENDRAKVVEQSWGFQFELANAFGGDFYDPQKGEAEITAAQNRARRVGWVGPIAGVIAGATAAAAGYFWIFGDDPSRYDEFLNAE